jgi:hypothetical protein
MASQVILGHEQVDKRLWRLLCVFGGLWTVLLHRGAIHISANVPTPNSEAIKASGANIM